MGIRMKLVVAVLAMSASSMAAAETLYDATDSSTHRRSHNAMAKECDGSTRGKCYMDLAEAFKVIGEYYFINYAKGVRPGTPEHGQAEAMRKRDLHGMTRAEIFLRADELKGKADE